MEALAAADDRIATEWHLIAGHQLIRLGQSAKAKEQERARRQAKEDAERARKSAAQDQRMAPIVREAVAADRRDGRPPRSGAAAQGRARSGRRPDHAGRQDPAPGGPRPGPAGAGALVRRQRKAVRGRIPRLSEAAAHAG